MQDRDLVLGIDIGGTKTAFGFVDREGTIFNATSMLTHADASAQTFVSRLHQRIEKSRINLSSPHGLRGIGIGAPNAHHDRGKIEKAVNLNWGESVDFVELVRKYYDLPVSITNDANAAAAGEMLFGNARGMKHFLVITLGTGLGSGIVVDGHLLYGASGFAGELGHTVVDPEGRQCSCGKRGCLETYVSATGLTRTARELLATRCNSSALREINDQDMTSKQIFDLAEAGDAIASEAFERTARILGMKLADAVAHLSPEAIFLAGGLAAAGEILLVPTEQYMNDFLFRAYRGTVKLMPSGLETGTSAILGAAALIWSELKL
ncbi:MAG: glucokinase [Deltaproteobacteria bacterium HGW-Deltaproteobacteria-6]|jgi:glucokinase|nr:MAG: glucokinase [Deltaproteobacteria bacterium HGW-Deltaproteobacteria-6]